MLLAIPIPTAEQMFTAGILSARVTMFTEIIQHTPVTIRAQHQVRVLTPQQLNYRKHVPAARYVLVVIVRQLLAIPIPTAEQMFM